MVIDWIKSDLPSKLVLKAGFFTTVSIANMKNISFDLSEDCW